MKPKHLSALVIALMLVAATPVLAANDFTVGQFVQELAKVKHVNATDAQIAVDSLRAVGIRVPAGLDLGANLTEGAVVEISRAAGLRVATNNPSAPFNESQVDSFFSAFSVELGVGGENDDPPTSQESIRDRDPSKFDPFTKGKGNHYAKGHRSPTEPE
jgi:hypothetical protein